MEWLFILIYFTLSKLVRACLNFCLLTIRSIVIFAIKEGSATCKILPFIMEEYFRLLIKTWITHCIHCKKWVQFASENAGIPELGTIGRGEHM